MRRGPARLLPDPMFVAAVAAWLAYLMFAYWGVDD